MSQSVSQSVSSESRDCFVGEATEATVVGELTLNVGESFEE